jgi:MFS family permease
MARRRALAMETWPQRSRGFMGSVLHGSWGLGALLSSAAYGLLYDHIGWRGLLLIGVLPALVIVYIRKYVKEPEIWIENRRKQRFENREFRAPLFSIFRRGLLANTLTACWLMASAFVVGYSVGGMFPSYLQKDLGLPTGYVALPVMLQSLMFFLSAMLWGWCADRFGRRITLMITSLVTIPIAPLYLLTTDYTMIVAFFTLQGFFGGGMHTQVAPLSIRALPDRGAGDGHWFLLSSRSDLRRPCGAGPVIFLDGVAHGLCDTDDDRHHRRRRLGLWAAHRRRMMSVSAHDRISGSPQMVRAWNEFLHYAKGQPGVAFLRKDEIARYALESQLTLRESETI